MVRRTQVNIGHSGSTVASSWVQWGRSRWLSPWFNARLHVEGLLRHVRLVVRCHHSVDYVCWSSLGNCQATAKVVSREFTTVENNFDFGMAWCARRSPHDTIRLTAVIGQATVLMCSVSLWAEAMSTEWESPRLQWTGLKRHMTPMLKRSLEILLELNGSSHELSISSLLAATSWSRERSSCLLRDETLCYFFSL